MACNTEGTLLPELLTGREPTLSLRQFWVLFPFDPAKMGAFGSGSVIGPFTLICRAYPAEEIL